MLAFNNQCLPKVQFFICNYLRVGYYQLVAGEAFASSYKYSYLIWNTFRPN